MGTVVSLSSLVHLLFYLIRRLSQHLKVEAVSSQSRLISYFRRRYDLRARHPPRPWKHQTVAGIHRIQVSTWHPSRAGIRSGASLSTAPTIFQAVEDVSNPPNETPGEAKSRHLQIRVCE